MKGVKRPVVFGTVLILLDLGFLQRMAFCQTTAD